MVFKRVIDHTQISISNEEHPCAYISTRDQCARSRLLMHFVAFITEHLSSLLIFQANFIGLPAISVPVGCDSANLPIGLQMMGHPWQEGTLLRQVSWFAFHVVHQEKGCRLDVNSLYYWAHIPHVTPWVCTKSCVRF
jgi:hypothetical protein